MPSYPAFLHPLFIRLLRSPHWTPVKLEKKQFLVEINRLTDKTWQSWKKWVASTLADKPAESGTVSWLRVRCLRQSTQGVTHG